jgi:hypothetical protein
MARVVADGTVTDCSINFRFRANLDRPLHKGKVTARTVSGKVAKCTPWRLNDLPHNLLHGAFQMAFPAFRAPATEATPHGLIKRSLFFKVGHG